jgi:hypothetical protein
MAYFKRELVDRSAGTSLLYLANNFDTDQSGVVAIKFQTLVFDTDTVVNDGDLSIKGSVVTQGTITGKVLYYNPQEGKLYVYDVQSSGSPGGTFAAGAVTWTNSGAATILSVAVPPVYITSVDAFVSKGTVTLSWGGNTPSVIFAVNGSFNYGRRGNNFARKIDATGPDGTMLITTESDFTSEPASYSLMIDFAMAQV